MNNFTFYSPTYFVFGKDEEKKVGTLVRRFGGSRVLIHYGGGSVVRSGLLDRVRESLKEEKIFFSCPRAMTAPMEQALRSHSRLI